MSEKIKFAKEMQEVATSMAQLIERLPAISSVWADREYNAGAGDKAIVDADVVSLGITKADMSAFITPFIVQMTNFVNNQPVVSDDFGSVLNKLRTDL